MKIDIIGGGGVFSKDNSSFLVTLNNSKRTSILIDCPNNAFEYIKDNNIDIANIFITHTHQDHIGGLEKLIYYNYFIKNKITKIYTGKEIDIEKYLPKQIVYENGILVHVKMYELNKKEEQELIYFGSEGEGSIVFQLIKGNHIVLPNYGIVFSYTKEAGIITQQVVITGDTKASKNLSDLFKESLEKDIKLTVFHDYQFLKKSINSIHCCNDDFEHYYNDIKDNIKWYKYHNEDFNEKYKDKVLNFFSQG